MKRDFKRFENRFSRTNNGFHVFLSASDNSVQVFFCFCEHNQFNFQNLKVPNDVSKNPYTMYRLHSRTPCMVVTKVPTRSNVLCNACCGGFYEALVTFCGGCEKSGENRRTRILMHISDRDRKQQHYTKLTTKGVPGSLSSFRTSFK